MHLASEAPCQFRQRHPKSSSPRSKPGRRPSGLSLPSSSSKACCCCCSGWEFTACPIMTCRWSSGICWSSSTWIRRRDFSWTSRRQLGRITPHRFWWWRRERCFYSLFSLVEGIGLIFRVSWAGWMAIGESVFFIPIEVYDLLHRLPVEGRRHPGPEYPDRLVSVPKSSSAVQALSNPRVTIRTVLSSLRV